MTELKLEISEGQITNAIAVAMAESFAPEKRDALLRDIIRAHLNHKSSSWDKETLLSKAVGELVRKIASEQVSKIVEEMRPDIERITTAGLGASFRATVLEALERSLQSVAVRNLSVSVHFPAEQD